MIVFIISIIILILYILFVFWCAKRNQLTFKPKHHPRQKIKLKFLKFIFLGEPFETRCYFKITHYIFLLISVPIIVLNFLCIINTLTYSSLFEFFNQIYIFLFLFNIDFGFVEIF